MHKLLNNYWIPISFTRHWKDAERVRMGNKEMESELPDLPSWTWVTCCPSPHPLEVIWMHPAGCWSHAGSVCDGSWITVWEMSQSWLHKPDHISCRQLPVSPLLLLFIICVFCHLDKTSPKIYSQIHRTEKMWWLCKACCVFSLWKACCVFSPRVYILWYSFPKLYRKIIKTTDVVYL